VGWVVDAALSLGFGISAIIEAVKKHEAQKAFDTQCRPGSGSIWHSQGSLIVRF
jgi:hypothetical protein